MPEMETRRMVAAAVEAADSKKAEETRILELDPADSAFTDYFLIASAANERQAQTIAEEIERRLKRDFHVRPNSIEGLRRGEWILMDYVDFVIHIFLKEKRAYYDIERLRKSARPVEPAQLRRQTRTRAAARPKRAVAAKPAAKRKAGSGARLASAGVAEPKSSAKPSKPRPKRKPAQSRSKASRSPDVL